MGHRPVCASRGTHSECQGDADDAQIRHTHTGREGGSVCGCVCWCVGAGRDPERTHTHLQHHPHNPTRPSHTLPSSQEQVERGIPSRRAQLMQGERACACAQEHAELARVCSSHLLASPVPLAHSTTSATPSEQHTHTNTRVHTLHAHTATHTDNTHVPTSCQLWMCYEGLA